MEKVPTYLKAVTVLEPVGNVAAETSAAVENMQRSGFSHPMKFGVPELFSRYRYVLALGAVGAFVTLALVLFASKQPPININTSGPEMSSKALGAMSTSTLVRPLKRVCQSELTKRNSSKPLGCDELQDWMEFVLSKNISLLPLLFALAPLFASASALGQNVQTQAPCSPVVDRTQGNVTVTFSGGCTIGITPSELEKIIESALARRTIPAELLDRYEMLRRQFGVTDAALGTFFLVLGERKVPTEDLDAKLREIAARHLTLLKQAAASGDDDPQVAAIKWSACPDNSASARYPAPRASAVAAQKEAVAAIAVGDYARAEELLQRAFDTDLAAARRAQDAVRRAQDAADKRFLTAAKTRADLGELKLTELRYAAAVEDFQAAAETETIRTNLRSLQSSLGGSMYRSVPNRTDENS
jgi:tetratricopeptide (TPR) repeat protein